MGILIVISPLIVLLILRIRLNMSSKDKNDEIMEEFWAREREARFARNVDISNLPLFIPDMECLPFLPSSDDKRRSELEAKVISSGREPMLDLHEFTNTDLKIKYGNGNFTTISSYDQNFMYFTRDLFQWGKYLYENNYTDDALTVLEYLISITQNIVSAFTILAKIYRDNKEPDKISNLINIVESTKDSITKQTTLRSLRDIINSY
ncbi:MAG: hypothetical protein HFH14_05230 [Lachnospiraceae bacterium]|nr:hypothetical protein [Lachnospiraceae bacterium]